MNTEKKRKCSFSHYYYYSHSRKDCRINWMNMQSMLFRIWSIQPQMSGAFVLSEKIIDWSIYFSKSINFKSPGTVWFCLGTNRDTSALSLSDKKHICEVGTPGRQRPDLPFACQPKIISKLKKKCKDNISSPYLSDDQSGQGHAGDWADQLDCGPVVDVAVSNSKLFRLRLILIHWKQNN